MAFKCPHCQEETLSVKDKYRLGWWMTVICASCGGRIAAFPWTLSLMTMLYVWNVMWWVGLINFNSSYHYLIYMAICWILLDLANLFLMPLSRLKRKTQP